MNLIWIPQITLGAFWDGAATHASIWISELGIVFVYDTFRLLIRPDGSTEWLGYGEDHDGHITIPGIPYNTKGIGINHEETPFVEEEANETE